MPSRNPTLVKEHARRKNFKRKAMKYGVYDEPIDSLIVLERQDGICGICGKDVDPFGYQIDHIVPFARGGRHNYKNVQVVHPACNSAKSFDGETAFAEGTPAALRDKRVRDRDEKIVSILELGATYGEVAALLGVSDTTIKNRVKAMRVAGRIVLARAQGMRLDPSKNGRKKT